LKEYFNQPEIPEQYEKYSGHFRFIESESKENLSEEFDVDYLRVSQEQRFIKQILFIRLDME